MVCNNLELMLLIHSFNRFYFFFIYLFIHNHRHHQPNNRKPTISITWNHILLFCMVERFIFLIFFSVFFYIYSIIHLTKWSLMRYMIPNLSFMYSSLKYVKKRQFQYIKHTKRERERQIKKMNKNSSWNYYTFACMYVCSLFIDLRILLITNNLHLIRIKSLSINECFFIFVVFPFFDCCHINNSWRM